MKNVLNCLICLLLVASLFACKKEDDSKVLVTINDDKITMAEFNKELDKIPMNMKMMVATESGKKSFLDRLIIKKLLLKEAEKSKCGAGQRISEQAGGDQGAACHRIFAQEEIDRRREHDR